MSNTTDSKQGEALLPCPFCGKVPDGRSRYEDSIVIWHTGECRIAGVAFSVEQWNSRASLAAVEEDGSTATIAWRIVTNYYPDDDELADAIKAALDNERRLLTVKSNPLLSSEVAEKIAKHIKGKNSDYFSTKDGLAELESITSRHFAAAASSPHPAAPLQDEHRCPRCGRRMQSDFDEDVGMWSECANCDYREAVSSSPAEPRQEGEQGV